MNYREKMKEYLKEPNEICNHYGKWGILNKEQRDLITRLLNEMDEADNYIKKMKQENARLKENNMSMQEEMARTWGKADLYKEVIDEVRKFIEDWLFDAGGNGASMTYEDINELLQILDKVKG